MIMTITLAVSFLVALNFILLFTSCNKTPKHKTSNKSSIIKNQSPEIVTKKLAPTQLAPTGS
jgi:hypothetical protein